MTVSAAKPEEKRLGWFVPTAVDQAESCVKPAAEGRNLARMPNPQHSETERLDHGPNWLKHTEDGLLLGECRLKQVPQQIDVGFVVPMGIIKRMNHQALCLCLHDFARHRVIHFDVSDVVFHALKSGTRV